MALRDKARRSTMSGTGIARDLVHQFSDPLDFFRELIQNSIDAGANTVRASASWEAGRARLAVEDDGEGMTEKVIDDYLLVLFKSSKEDDLTKIGKFGIGFVSVFAPGPDLVRVWTSKAGESWRLDFPGPHRWDKFRVERPRDGTLVEVFVPMDEAKYAETARAAREKVRFWCRHADTRITFEDLRARTGPESINEPFDLPGGAAVRHEEEGTEVVMGFTDLAEPFFGFYNRGLTLKEGRRLFFPGVEVKVKSRWLDHTLTRDAVMEDDNYRKVMDLLERLRDGPLREALRRHMEAAAAAVSMKASAGPVAPADSDLRAWERGAACFRDFLLTQRWRGRASSWRAVPMVEGRTSSVEDLSARGVDLYCDVSANRVTRRLARQGARVLALGPWLELVCARAAAVRGERVDIPKASAAFILPTPLKDAELSRDLRALLGTLRGMDASSGARYRGICAADFDYPGSTIVERAFVTQKALGELSPAEDRPWSSLTALFRAKRWAVMNRAHPFVRRLTGLHGRRPGVAAFLALKVMHLNDGVIDPKRKTHSSNLAERLELRLARTALELERGR